MTRRRIVSEKECTLCTLANAPASIEAVFAEGYVAGRHAVGHGERAEERFCSRHARVLDEAMIEYVRHGILVR